MYTCISYSEKCVMSWWKNCLLSGKTTKQISFLSMNKNKKENKNTTTTGKNMYFCFYFINLHLRI